MGININLLSSANFTAWNASFHSGDSADAWVSYNATTQMLSLSLRYRTENQSTDNTNLCYKVDLKEV
ncbi:putative non-specific serine/threonine protein kinase [Helianthus debilis subsp. tardiflorus]